MRLVRATELDEGQRLAAARFARAAHDAFYASLPDAVADKAIAGAFGNEGDEIADALVALDEDQPRGLVAGYPLAEMAQRQRASLHQLLSALPTAEVTGFVANARALAAEVSPAEGDGFYLARIAVAPEARGGGLADTLLAAFLAEAGDRDAVLHVRGDNARAIAFYLKRGFAVTDDARRWWLMRKPAT